MPQVWEFVFLMLIMKLPIAYLCWVVYWAVKAEPKPPEYAAAPAVLDPGNDPITSTRWRRRPRRPGPHGSPTRRDARAARSARTFAR